MFPENVVGIIAEYNPFHNGHAYHLQQAAELAEAQGVVAVLSSNFVQRGEPSFEDKWSRAEGALAGGADLVLELPVPFSCHNAGVFARGGVKILSSTGLITHLSFGIEAEIPEQERIVDILLHEPPCFKENLKNFLKTGLSFVEARAQAINELVPGARASLSTPNNNLAFAYLLELARRPVRVKPLPVLRKGADYHSLEKGQLASATAIRHYARRGEMEAVRKAMPEGNFGLLLRDLASGRCILDESRVMAAYRIILARSGKEELAKMAEMTEGLESRLKSAAMRATDLDEFLRLCSTRRYPRGRICRHLVHSLLGLDHWINRSFQRLGPPCIRVLGANSKGRELLRRMRDTATLPVIGRCDETVSAPVSAIMGIERKATQIWETFVSSPRIDAEKKAKPILIP